MTLDLGGEALDIIMGGFETGGKAFPRAVGAGISRHGGKKGRLVGRGLEPTTVPACLPRLTK